MVDLAGVLPADVLESARNTVVLQELLMSLTTEALPAALATILGLPFRLTSEGVLTLTNNILLSVQYRPYSLPQAALLTKSLVESGDAHPPPPN
jgi:hypothetical protein